MLSGIGDAQELSSLGIESIVDLPFVGQNLQASYMLSFTSIVVTYFSIGPCVPHYVLVRQLELDAR